MSKKFNFNITHTHGLSRAGELETIHGTIKTPVFMPVGTRATVKAIMPESLENIDIEIILCNTYHLMLKPGIETIKQFGGLHKFMNWKRPILTDSGGFQIMSLSGLVKTKEEGVEFRSHIDGSKHFVTPEYATSLQHDFNTTITMAFDECIKYPSSYIDTELSTARTTRWASRSRDAFKIRDGYGQFGIMQGGMYKDLREKSANDLIELDFEGYAIGGLAVGEGHDKMMSVLDYATNLLPFNKARYLMGVGKPLDIIEAVKRGVDMFDCVIPTRSARNGQAFTKSGTINIRNSRFANDLSALDEECDCYVCQNYTKSYIHHTVRIGEIIGSMLMTWHNIAYFKNLMSRIRNYIINDKEIDFIS